MMLDSGNQKIRIFAKKLPSGNFQVKFYVTSNTGGTYYGYSLVKSGCKVSDVVTRIYQKLQEIDNPEKYFHGHLYNIGNKKYPDPDFVIFREYTMDNNPDSRDRTHTYPNKNQYKSKVFRNEHI